MSNNPVPLREALREAIDAYVEAIGAFELGLRSDAEQRNIGEAKGQLDSLLEQIPIIFEASENAEGEQE